MFTLVRFKLYEAVWTTYAQMEISKKLEIGEFPALMEKLDVKSQSFTSMGQAPDGNQSCQTSTIPQSRKIVAVWKGLIWGGTPWKSWLAMLWAEFTFSEHRIYIFVHISEHRICGGLLELCCSFWVQNVDFPKCWICMHTSVEYEYNYHFLSADF